MHSYITSEFDPFINSLRIGLELPVSGVVCIVFMVWKIVLLDGVLGRVLGCVLGGVLGGTDWIGDRGWMKVIRLFIFD